MSIHNKTLIEVISDDNYMEVLEGIIDVHGLDATLEAIGDICNEKSEHAITNWQDQTLSKLWHNLAGIVHRASGSVSRYTVNY